MANLTPSATKNISLFLHIRTCSDTCHLQQPDLGQTDGSLHLAQRFSTTDLERRWKLSSKLHSTVVEVCGMLSEETL